VVSKKYYFYWILKNCLLVGVLVLFIGGFVKIFQNLPNNIIARLTFLITYLWFTIGININLIKPLITVIDKQINQGRH